MKLISSVIHNRLKNPSQTAGRLECDSTKDYIKKYVTPITDVNLVNKYADAYNTYSAQGLPPGPICNPGAAAIKAALYPSNTKYCPFETSKECALSYVHTLEGLFLDTVSLVPATPI